ncbi:MAG: hypothetical protein EOO76_21160, partial [Novosphingobium sp.]
MPAIQPQVTGVPMFRSSTGALALTCALAGAAFVAAPASAQSFQEGTSQWNLALIHADAANSRGYTGAGVTVGVLDSGIDVANPDLAGQVSDLSHDVFAGGSATDDPNGHGTHVAGIIAAARDGLRVQGVAYDAELAAFRLPPEGTSFLEND